MLKLIRTAAHNCEHRARLHTALAQVAAHPGPGEQSAGGGSPTVTENSNSHLVHHIDRPGQRVAGLTAGACSSLFGSPLAAEHACGLWVRLPAIDEVWEPRGTECARLSSLLLLWYRPTVTPFRFSPARFLLPLWIQVSNRWCLRPSTAAHVPCSALPLFSKRTRQKKQAVIYLTVFQSCWL